MGGGLSGRSILRRNLQPEEEEARREENDLQRLQKARMKMKVSVELQVAHFTPSSFPLIPVVTEKSQRIIYESWKHITEKGSADDAGSVISGMTLFYNEFYSRLGMMDSNNAFDSILTRFTSGANTIAAKGAILFRIISFQLNLDFQDKNLEYVLYKLGRSHCKMGIRPWMYAAFIQTLLLTIASRLEHRATHDVMEAWVNVFAFVLKLMLPSAIRGLVQNDEMTMTSVITHIEGDKNRRGGLYERAKDRLVDHILRSGSSNSSKKKKSLSERYSVSGRNSYGGRGVSSSLEQSSSRKRSTYKKTSFKVAVADEIISESPSPSLRILEARLPSGRYSIGGIKEAEGDWVEHVDQK